MFPPKSSSDSEAEEEFSADRLPLPRAGRLAEFLGSEEETGSTWDSSESLREKPQVLGHEGRCHLLESLFLSDPDSDEHPSEDDEDLDGFLQDQGKDQQPVAQPLSPRYDCAASHWPTLQPQAIPAGSSLCLGQGWGDAGSPVLPRA